VNLREACLADGGVALSLNGPCDLSGQVERWQATGVPYVYTLLPLKALDQAECLARAGFRLLTKLETHTRLVQSEPPSRPGLRLHPWENYPEAMLRSLVWQTHHETRDVPELNAFQSADTPLSPAAISLVAEVDQKPLGVVLLDRSPIMATAEISFVGVIPNARRQGLGEAILQAAMALLDQEVFSEVRLSFDERNQPARRLYGKLGFRLCGLQQVWAWNLA
jgi:mycothiol synthase